MNSSGRLWTLQDLAPLPSLGWIRSSSSVQPLAELAQSLGLAWLGVKRDDQLGFAEGGSKFRKLDCLLATEPYATARQWASVGAIGSGHLVACTAAARHLGRTLDAYLFWEPISAGVLDNLAYTASGPTHLEYAKSRPGAFLQCPPVWLGYSSGGTANIPPGGSHPVGIAGMVKAALELAEQIQAGLLPEPDRLYVSLGSGGNAVGLALGLALAGLKTSVHAIAVVERLLSPRLRLRHLMQGARAYIQQTSLQKIPANLQPKLHVNRRHLGHGYAYPTQESLLACQQMERYGIQLEPVYTGKAMAALFTDAHQLQGQSVLFWNTARGVLPKPQEGWRARLPGRLRQYLKNVGSEPEQPSKRAFFIQAAVTASAVILARIGLYPGFPGLDEWKGQILSQNQARVLMAASEVILQPIQNTNLVYRQIAVNVDRYLVNLPKSAVTEIKVMLFFVEQAPFLLERTFSRFSGMDFSEKNSYMQTMSSHTGLWRMIYQGLRDLCMLGYYQQDAAWKALGYEGPMFAPASSRPRHWRYQEMVAPKGLLPRGLAP